jgi:5-methylcytosine-specific restriction endonuclease McrA
MIAFTLLRKDEPREFVRVIYISVEQRQQHTLKPLIALVAPGFGGNNSEVRTKHTIWCMRCHKGERVAMSYHE